MMPHCRPILIFLFLFARVPASAESSDAGLGLQISAERVIRLYAPYGIDWPVSPSDASYSPPSNMAEPGGKLVAVMRQSPDPAVRLRAVESIENPASPEGLTTLLEGLSDPAPVIRAMAAERVADIKTSVLLESVLETLDTGDGFSIACMDRALPHLTQRLGPGFLDVLNNAAETPVRRRIAATALGRMVYKPAAATLAAGLGAENVEVARACAQALLLLKEIDAAPTWLNALAHPDPVIQALAVDALALLNTLEAFEAVKHIARGASGAAPELQALAVQRLAEWPGAQAAPALVDVMELNPAFRRMALGLLRARTGKDYGESAAEWRPYFPSPP